MNEPVGGWASLVMNEIKIYENKESELYLNNVNQKELKNYSHQNPGKHTAPQPSTPNLVICLANKFVELNWHHLKLNRTKGRSRIEMGGSSEGNY